MRKPRSYPYASLALKPVIQAVNRPQKALSYLCYDIKMPHMNRLKQAVLNREIIHDIKRRYLAGEITREAAKMEAEPIIRSINERGALIAKKWNKKYVPQTFIGLMR